MDGMGGHGKRLVRRWVGMDHEVYGNWCRWDMLT